MNGIYTAIITPFKSNLEVDFEYLAKLLRFQVQNGIKGVVVCGTNGEFPSLSVEENKRIIEAACNYTDKLEVIACIGRTSIKEVLEICYYASELVDGVLLIPPFYFKNVEINGLVNYFKKILDSIDLPVILYNIPKYSGNEISLELINRFPHKNLSGIKDSSGDLSTIKRYVQNFPELKILCGSDALIFEALRVGACGAISALSNAFPKKVLGIYNGFIKGNFKMAEKAQRDIEAVRGIIKKYPRGSALKQVLNFIGFEKSYVRPPLVDLNEGQINQLRGELARWIL
jgi:4-hydroxy-tetrahydrodipicolinate synthase